MPFNRKLQAATIALAAAFAAPAAAGETSPALPTKNADECVSDAFWDVAQQAHELGLAITLKYDAQRISEIVDDCEKETNSISQIYRGMHSMSIKIEP